MNRFRQIYHLIQRKSTNIYSVSRYIRCQPSVENILLREILFNVFIWLYWHFTEHGNPDGLPGLYSGSVAEFTKADTVIFRTDLYNLTTGQKVQPFKRTVKYDSKWLDSQFTINDNKYFTLLLIAINFSHKKNPILSVPSISENTFIFSSGKVLSSI